MKKNDNLDFLKIDKKSENADLYSEFHRIATILFEQFVLIVNRTKEFTLVDLEFYFLSLWHQDYFTYGHPDQKQFGEWFKHAAGIDLAIGSPDEDIYAGILIRGIREMKGDRKFINGPLNVRTALSNGNLSASTEELRNIIKVKRIPSLGSKKIFVSSRVGLTEKAFYERYQKMKKGDIFKNLEMPKPVLFIDRNYRFLTDIGPANKYKEKIKVAENTHITRRFSLEDINGLYQWTVIKK